MENVICKECCGNGYLVVTNITKATKKKRNCPKCGGTGREEEYKFRVSVVNPQVIFIELCKVGVPISIIEAWLFDRKDERNEVYIKNMYTHPMHRRRGHMRKIVEDLIELVKDKGNPSFKTSYIDSSKEGINLLESVGFKKEGDNLCLH